MLALNCGCHSKFSSPKFFLKISIVLEKFVSGRRIAVVLRLLIRLVSYIRICLTMVYLAIILSCWDDKSVEM
jgi:hypothetical protein